MSGSLVDVEGGPHLDELAQIHDSDGIGHVLDHGQVVGDEDIGEMPTALEFLQEVQDLGLDGDVQGRDGFVGHDQLGVEGERPGQPDPLTLAAREFMGIELGCLGTQTHLAHEAPGPLQALGRCTDVLDDEGLFDDRTHPHPRVERGIGILEHQLHVLPLGGAGRPGSRRTMSSPSKVMEPT